MKNLIPTLSSQHYAGYAMTGHRDLAAAERARRLRAALGYKNGRQFAMANGISYSTWNSIEAGITPISPRIYRKIARICPGVTYDWLRFGDARGLAIDLAKSLGGLL